MSLSDQLLGYGKRDFNYVSAQTRLWSLSLVNVAFSVGGNFLLYTAIQNAENKDPNDDLYGYICLGGYLFAFLLDKLAYFSKKKQYNSLIFNIQKNFVNDLSRKILSLPTSAIRENSSAIQELNGVRENIDKIMTNRFNSIPAVLSIVGILVVVAAKYQTYAAYLALASLVNFGTYYLTSKCVNRKVKKSDDEDNNDKVTIERKRQIDASTLGETISDMVTENREMIRFGGKKEWALEQIARRFILSIKSSEAHEFYLHLALQIQSVVHTALFSAALVYTFYRVKDTASDFEASDFVFIGFNMLNVLGYAQQLAEYRKDYRPAEVRLESLSKLLTYKDEDQLWSADSKSDMQTPNLLDLKEAPDISYHQVGFKYYGQATREDSANSAAIHTPVRKSKKIGLADLEETEIIIDTKDSEHKSSPDKMTVTVTHETRNFDLTFKKNTVTVILGKSGCGKTTIARYLLGDQKPETGTISIDGQDITTFTLASLRKQIALIPQEPSYLSCPSLGSVEANISLSSVADGTEMERARRVGLLRSLGNKSLKETSANSLSGGQKQLLAVARSISPEKKIYIFDEPTSALDMFSQAKLIRTIEELKKTATVIVISHRLEVTHIADLIVVMDKDNDTHVSTIVDQGKHAELLARCDLYQRLWREQEADENQEKENRLLEKTFSF